jgi:ferritin-like metal-binding protein YciE
MPIQNPKDLFLYELSVMHDAQKKSGQWKGEIAGQVRDTTLQQTIRMEQEQGQRMVNNLDACFQALGTQPADVPCLAFDGMRAEYQQLMSQNLASEMVDLYVVGTLLKAAHFGVGSYKSLVDKAMLLGETRCAQILRTNLVMIEETSGRTERISHEMCQRVMATA